MESSCNLNITEAVQILQMGISIPSFVLGLLGNVAVLAIFCCGRGGGPWSYMMVYITNMALADCTVLFFLPFKMYSYRKKWPFSAHFCVLLVYVYYVNMYVSIFTATAISVVRYVGIKYPFRAKQVLSPRKALVVCVLIWVVTCSIGAGFYKVDAPPEANGTRFMCFQKVRSKPLPLSFILVLELLGYFLPLATMTFCSAHIIRVLSRPTGGNGGGRDGGSSAEKAQCVRIIAANLAVFVVCFTPFHLGFLLKHAVETHRPGDCGLLEGVHGFTHVSFSLASANCCLDAFTYYFATRDSWRRVSTCCRPVEGSSANAII
ncbi:G-protein coupled receptor 55-like [Anguilla anguilla]|uniref:G-protein coupled receptor 55-like n=1 Tax=Anguilla anguilla TaxID=7936 RepID=UPI0015AF8603|nr:G-protein coupled receptor 55-like [Anguilla anguilla]